MNKCPYCGSLKRDQNDTCNNIECVNKELTRTELAEPSLSRGMSIHDILSRPRHRMY